MFDVTCHVIFIPIKSKSISKFFIIDLFVQYLKVIGGIVDSELNSVYTLRQCDVWILL